MRGEQGLQGVNMPQVGPTFFSLPLGDHPEGDGLTRLQTAFAGASSADLSTYAIGSGGNNGGTLGAGYFEIVQNSATFKALAWENAGLATLDGPHCLEFFFEAFETSANPPSTCNIEQHKITLMSIPTMQILGHAGGINNVGWVATPTGEGFSLISASPAVDVFGSVHHVVYQHDENGALSIWYDGVRQLDSYGTWDGSGVTGPYVYLGATGIGGQTITIRFYGVRVRRAEMYSGASFTPPSSPAAWGPP
jgi:hypothetical protein